MNAVLKIKQVRDTKLDSQKGGTILKLSTIFLPVFTMKGIESIKHTLRNILTNSDSRPTSSPPPSYPVITIKHLYAIGPQGTPVKYPGPPIRLTPSPYTGGNLRYSTNGNVAYQSALADLVRIAKMTLLFAETCAAPWNSSKLQDKVSYEADNRVECKMLPLLNIHSSQAMELGSAFFDMDTGGFSRELMSASATWGVNLALLVRWQPGRRPNKPLPLFPIAGDESAVDRRRGSADTIWPGPNAPRYGD